MIVSERRTHRYITVISIVLIFFLFPVTSQVWASSFLPNEPALSDRCQRSYYQKHGEPLLLQYARQEAERKVRCEK